MFYFVVVVVGQMNGCKFVIKCILSKEWIIELGHAEFYNVRAVRVCFFYLTLLQNSAFVTS